VPAHLTLLYPFVEPPELAKAVRKAIEDVASHHAPFEYELSGMAVWPDTIYAAVAPTHPFIDLQHDLQAAFPAYPIYGRDATFRFVPHVTIAEGDAVADASVWSDPAWRTLPRPGRAAALEVIATGDDGRWRLVWRIPLAGTAPAAHRTADRMRS
jgi:2'-5' RNA ligase